AVAAMLLPLGIGLLQDAGLRPGESNFGRSLMIATAFGPLIGGIATPAGTAANIVALGQLKQLAGADVSFWAWMRLGVPASLLMIVAGRSLGLAVFDSGAARWLAWVLLGQITSVPDPLRPFVIVLAVAGLHLLFSSNTVTASIIIPILVALASDLHLDSWTTVAPAAFTSSLAFILVSEGPTTIIPYSSGYFSIRDMAKAGILMTVAA